MRRNEQHAMKTNPEKQQTPSPDIIATTSDHDAFFADEMDIDSEVRAQTVEAVSRILIWIAEAGSIQNRGVRATIMLYCVRPDLIGGITLEKIGDAAGMTRQATHKLAQEFHLSMGFLS